MAAEEAQPTSLEVDRFVAANIRQLRDGLKKISHCLEQLDENQLWWRPVDSMNSIANLLLHLSGNLRQWLICGLSDIPDQRQRQTEFDDRSMQDKQALLQRLEKTVDESIEQMSLQTTATLVAARRVQEFDIDGFTTIVDSVGHFCGHVQEIVHLTRCQLKENYRFEFTPQENT